MSEINGPDAVVVGYYAGRCVIKLAGTDGLLPAGTGLWLTPPSCFGREKCRVLAHAVLSDMAAHPAFVKAMATERTCEWQPMDGEHMPESWEGSCMVAWSFIDGGPAENDMRYCPKCGGKLVITKTTKEQHE